MSKIPDYIDVFGERWAVELVPDLMADGEKVFGVTYGDRRLIRICSTSQTMSGQWSTLNHEYKHAIFHMLGVSDALDPDLEEIIVRSLEHGDRQFMQQVGKQYMKHVAIKEHEE